MKKNFPIDLDLELEDEFIDDFGEIEGDKEQPMESPKRKDSPIHEDWNIVKAFNIINEEAPKSQLAGGLFIKCAELSAICLTNLVLTPFNALSSLCSLKLGNLCHSVKWARYLDFRACQ